MTRYRYILLFAIGLLFGCSEIHEDRELCPCYLSIDFSQVNPDIKKLHLWVFDSKGVLHKRDSLYPADYPRLYQVQVPRDTISYYVWGNVDNNSLLNDNSTETSYIMKEDLSTADSLFSYKSKVNTHSETISDTVIMNKEFATVDITLLGTVESLRDRLSLEAFCGSSGMYIDSRLVNSNTSIRVMPEQDFEDTRFKFRITRQQSLEDFYFVLVNTHDGVSTVMYKYPIGEWLLEKKYDMRARNLSDITITLDISLQYLDIVIENYKVVPPHDIEF